MAKHEFDNFGEFMKTPPIGTRLRWLGVPKSFFTKARTPGRVKRFKSLMWERRREQIVDPNTWNEASLVYGYLPLWEEHYVPQNTEFQVGEEIQ